jgi:hypothetical protein
MHPQVRRPRRPLRLCRAMQRRQGPSRRLRWGGGVRLLLHVQRGRTGDRHVQPGEPVMRPPAEFAAGSSSGSEAPGTSGHRQKSCGRTDSHASSQADSSWQPHGRKRWACFTLSLALLRAVLLACLQASVDLTALSPAVLEVMNSLLLARLSLCFTLDIAARDEDGLEAVEAPVVTWTPVAHCSPGWVTPRSFPCSSMSQQSPTS